MCDKPEFKSVKEILSSDKYIIPIYQRNYAWGVAHIRQLIQDVWDSICIKDNHRKYYIGTLVVYRRKDGFFEIVDGQQRLTSLHLIMCALRNESDDMGLNTSWYKGVNLSYEYRKRSTKSLEALYEHTGGNEINDEIMLENYRNVIPLIREIIGKDGYMQFYEYLFENVYITRVILPADTNLNHYFEIMNSRGEQLEKHEILKARILDAVKYKDRKMSYFIKMIWEACSNMNRFVQLNFRNKDLRKVIFTDSWNDFSWTDFEDLFYNCQSMLEESASKPFSIADILNMKKTDNLEKGDSNDDVYMFGAVINFPNFLLHVLRVMTKKDIPLDDKRLIEAFEGQKEGHSFTSGFIKNFIFELLRLRFYFDKYVIKRGYLNNGNAGEWEISSIKTDSSSYYTVNTFHGKEENSKCKMVQLMFHVSLPSPNYKHWLSAILLHISENNGSGEYLVQYLENLSKAYILDHFLAAPDKNCGYYKIIFENNGIAENACPDKITLPTYGDNIDSFIFNYLDYQLWKLGKDDSFKFTFRSSVEHFYPQHPIDSIEPMENEYLHNFGNLCLISSSKNSKLSNYSPYAKTEHYNKCGADSIKQKIMMDKVKEDGKWDKEDIKNHESEMEQIILDSLR